MPKKLLFIIVLILLFAGGIAIAGIYITGNFRLTNTGSNYGIVLRTPEWLIQELTLGKVKEIQVYEKEAAVYLKNVSNIPVNIIVINEPAVRSAIERCGELCNDVIVESNYSWEEASRLFYPFAPIAVERAEFYKDSSYPFIVLKDGRRIHVDSLSEGEFRERIKQCGEPCKDIIIEEKRLHSH